MTHAYDRLDELTSIEADFKEEIVKQPLPRFGGGRRGQLNKDHSRVERAMQEEIIRLWREENIPLADIRNRLECTDPYYYEGPHEGPYTPA